jgi:hypothetical protein
MAAAPPPPGTGFLDANSFAKSLHDKFVNIVNLP